MSFSGTPLFYLSFFLPENPLVDILRILLVVFLRMLLHLFEKGVQILFRRWFNDAVELRHIYNLVVDDVMQLRGSQHLDVRAIVENLHIQLHGEGNLELKDAVFVGCLHLTLRVVQR